MTKQNAELNELTHMPTRAYFELTRAQAVREKAKLEHSLDAQPWPEQVNRKARIGELERLIAAAASAGRAESEAGSDEARQDAAACTGGGTGCECRECAARAQNARPEREYAEPVPYFASPASIATNEGRVVWPTDPDTRHKLIQAALAEMRRAKAV